MEFGILAGRCRVTRGAPAKECLDDFSLEQPDLDPEVGLRLVVHRYIHYFPAETLSCSADAVRDLLVHRPFRG